MTKLGSVFSMYSGNTTWPCNPSPGQQHVSNQTKMPEAASKAYGGAVFKSTRKNKRKSVYAMQQRGDAVCVAHLRLLKPRQWRAQRREQHPHARRPRGRCVRLTRGLRRLPALRLRLCLCRRVRSSGSHRRLRGLL